MTFKQFWLKLYEVLKEELKEIFMENILIIIVVVIFVIYPLFNIFTGKW